LCVAALAVAATAEELSWDRAHALASATLSEMTRDEKNSLLKAYAPAGMSYVGNLPPVERLRVPSLNLADAGQGFRVQDKESVGTATAWPSGLAMGATWNPELVRQLGVALADEFRAKGANVILGPGLEVMRVARDGRGFEYISGDDPVLGAKLGAKYVEGVQNGGVMAVLKHFALHHQQENNKDESSNADARTVFELYYPPFQAAVDAGAASVMSAYSKVNETWAAENPNLLRRDLKGEIGFRGFVMSDWGGFNGEETAWHNGCDVDMWASFTEIGRNADPNKLSEEDVDDSVARVLAAMYKVGLFNQVGCTPPACTDLLQADVTSDAHTALARTAAAESIVLLKNEGSVLPITNSIKRIAIVGSAADAPGIVTIDYPSYPFPGDYYAGGGSGHVQTDKQVTPLRGITAMAETMGIDVVSSASNNVDAALALVRDADMTIVSVGTSATEDQDRASLNLDDGADAFISAIAAAAKATVVLAQAPGPFLTPWRDEVQGIAALFLGGQETGNAWADVLFGRAPSGRLPVMLPATEEDQIQPSSDLSIAYTEGMATSYRSQTLKAAFPFGHGLSYSSFDFTATVVRCAGAAEDVCVEVVSANIGNASAVAVPQLYLEFPPEAQHPVPLLKAFAKTGEIAPGTSETSLLRLSTADRSYWTVEGWVPAPTASLTAHIGASSAELPVVLPLGASALLV
jgi:beta-glucosidase